MFEEPEYMNETESNGMNESVGKENYSDGNVSWEDDPEYAGYNNVFQAIKRYGHDENFVPEITDEFCPTDAPAGSAAKVQVLAERVRKGLPLWHPEDRVTYNGLTGAGSRSHD